VLERDAGGQAVDGIDLGDADLVEEPAGYGATDSR
jgi:hypothetical protein